MKAINIIGAFVVLVANLVVSYNHSIELFHMGGFQGWMTHIAVIGAEVTFLMAALNIVVSRTKGEEVGKPAIAGGFLGVGLVSWSNIYAGWEFGIFGVLLGCVTPISLVIAESILSRAFLQNSKKQLDGYVLDDVSMNDDDHEQEDELGGLEETLEELGQSEDEQEDEVGPLEIAKRFYHSHGSLPSRSQLMADANCKEWPARKALNELKQVLA